MNFPEQIKKLIRSIPDYPKKGIIFRDVTTLFNNPDGMTLVINEFLEKYKGYDIDCIAGIEARGFILGGALAFALGKSFIPIRKKGKLPAETISVEYDLEYGTDVMEIHKDAFAAGSKVLVIDDLLATGGTALAAAQLIEKIGGKVVEIAFVVDLPDVGGRSNLTSAGYSVSYICEFEGD